MKCWPGCASVASTMKWYIVTARASAVRERSLRSSPVTSSSISKVLRKPHVSSGSVAARAPAIVPARRGGDERREVVGDRVLAVEEHRVVPQRRPALELREALVPVLAVGGEVD